MRKLRFNLNVATNALLCPNPQEFFSKAYITEDTVNNFRAIPGVKNATKVANVLFPDVLQATTCSFNASTSDLDATDIDVCAVSAMVEICRYDLESSFVSLQMAQGAAGSWDVPTFLGYYWNELAKEIQEEIAILRWRGDTGGSTGTFLDLCDGYEVKFAADPLIVPGGSGALTPANVLAAMNGMFALLPNGLVGKTSNLRFYVSSDIYVAFLQAAAVGNNNTFITAQLPAQYLGINVVLCAGMSTATMVLTDKDNLIYAFDGENDGRELKAINLEDTVAEPVLRTRAEIKIGFHYVNPTEIIFYQ
jgi:hypothetical protein